MQDQEEQLSAVSGETRRALAEERLQLEQQRFVLTQEVHMNTLESSGGQFYFLKTLKVRCPPSPIVPLAR
jgi:hypothetical protein